MDELPAMFCRAPLKMTHTSSSKTTMISKLSSALFLASAAMSFPAPPEGGVGVSADDIPNYSPMSDFDTASFIVGVNQEFLELDLFNNILASFSDEEFDAVGIDAYQRYYIQEMAEQEIGHAEMINNILASVGKTSQQCSYKYPYANGGGVKDALSLAEYVTRFGCATRFLPSAD